MEVSKKEGKVLNKAIDCWLETDVISEAESHKLRASYTVMAFDWKRAAKYSFWLAISCIVIAISSALADEFILELLKIVFSAPDSVKCIGFATLSAGLYFLGIQKRNKNPGKIYSNEAVFFLGVLSTAIAIAFLGKSLDTGSGHFSLLLLLAAIVYGALGLWFSSKLIWLFSLISLGSWFGAETGYVSGWGAYYLGMNYPLRFVFFGLVLLTVGSYVFHQWQSRREFLQPTKAMGLLYLFIALWIMSIFGNHSDPEVWIEIKQIELFHWSLFFALAAIAAIYHGVKYDDGMTRGFGLTFIFINLYTRYCEYFWDDTNKTIFFAVLGFSFWYVGTRAEKIWQISLIKNLAGQGDRKP
ncbi:hypothetical protein [Bacterioplanoides sp.]|uniref:hypothetical protein n=1 Tax=Bacterioplanoides sp. TaxID=2066072 RepID=UPI003B00DAC8